MKTFLYIFLFLLITNLQMFAQIENTADVKIVNLFKPANNVLEFDVVLNRTSSDWYYFANCTFHITFTNNVFQFDSGSLSILNTKSDLHPGIVTGNNMPLNGYISREVVLKDTLSLAILGPVTYQESDTIPFQKDILLGHYVITATDGRFIPSNIEWIKPENYYQAIAYKRSQDSVIDNSIIWYYTDDNVELNDGTTKKVTFYVDNNPIAQNILKNFHVIYTTDKKLTIDWTMEKEYGIKGFKITKAFRPTSTLSTNTLQYDTIYSWEASSPYYNQEMLSKGNSLIDQFYGYLPDSVKFRGAQYCYRLYANIYDTQGNLGADSLLAEACLPIPNAVIVEAKIIEPPGEKRPTIQFKIDDNCYMTGYIIDEVGKKVEELSVQEKNNEVLNNLKLDKGIYTSTYNPPPWVSDGYYQFILIAYPIDDNSVEISRSMVPFFLTRNRK